MIKCDDVGRVHLGWELDRMPKETIDGIEFVAVENVNRLLDTIACTTESGKKLVARTAEKGNDDA